MVNNKQSMDVILNYFEANPEEQSFSSVVKIFEIKNKRGRERLAESTVCVGIKRHVIAGRLELRYKIINGRTHKFIKLASKNQNEAK